MEKMTMLIFQDITGFVFRLTNAPIRDPGKDATYTIAKTIPISPPLILITSDRYMTDTTVKALYPVMIKKEEIRKNHYGSKNCNNEMNLTCLLQQILLLESTT